MKGGLKVGIMGAGSVGCYLGGRLAAAGVDVVMVGRERQAAELATSGLTTVDLDGGRTTLPSERVAFDVDAARLQDRHAVLCCVKSAQTESAARQFANVLPVGAVVVSMQNGVRNVDVLRSHLPKQVVLGGIVGFNVLNKGHGVFRRATSGSLVIENSSNRHARELDEALSVAGFDVERPSDIKALQWAKLVLNLNNAVSALSDVPTREIVLTSGYRRIVAALITEALEVMHAAGIRPARLGTLPVSVFPHALRLPTVLVRLVARAQLKIDPEARSSMWEDLARRRRTEVDWLNGEIVRLADSCGMHAPLNRRIVELVHEVEARGEGSPKLDAESLWRALVTGGAASHLPG